MSEAITFQKLESREVNIVQVAINVESGCNPHDGEYSLHICGFIGSLDLSSYGGVDDVSLIRDCVENNLDEINLPSEGTCILTLEESGEWEGFNWLKYYIVKRCVNLEGEG